MVPVSVPAANTLASRAHLLLVFSFQLLQDSPWETLHEGRAERPQPEATLPLGSRFALGGGRPHPPLAGSVSCHHALAGLCSPRLLRVEAATETQMPPASTSVRVIPATMVAAIAVS